MNSRPRKPSSPWKIVYVTDCARVEQKYRSRPALYRAADEERTRIADGTSCVVYMSAYQWDTDRGDWVLYERLSIEKTS